MKPLQATDGQNLPDVVVYKDYRWMPIIMLLATFSGITILVALLSRFFPMLTSAKDELLAPAILASCIALALSWISSIYSIKATPEALIFRKNFRIKTVRWGEVREFSKQYMSPFVVETDQGNFSLEGLPYTVPLRTAIAARAHNVPGYGNFPLAYSAEHGSTATFRYSSRLSSFIGCVACGVLVVAAHSFVLIEGFRQDMPEMAARGYLWFLFVGTIFLVWFFCFLANHWRKQHKLCLKHRGESVHVSPAGLTITRGTEKTALSWDEIRAVRSVDSKTHGQWDYQIIIAYQGAEFGFWESAMDGGQSLVLALYQKIPEKFEFTPRTGTRR